MDQSYFCANCMEKISAYQDTCPYCGFRNKEYIPPSHALMPMTVLQGRYLIGKVLGAGGFGITYVARDLKVDKKVCIKEFFVRGSMYREGGTSEMVSLITDGNASERLYYANLEKFEQEAKILGRFDNVPGIVGVSDYFHENNTAYIVMEYLEGTTLKAYVQSHGGKLSWEELADKLRPVFSSLQALHDQGVYHRDISPDNIMLLRDGSLKVFDFGGARVDTDGHGASAMIIRKIGYSPIEQYSRGKQGPWTDVYAMAATLYYCLTGKVPADSTDRAGEIDSLVRFETLNVKVPRNVEKAIYKGLEVKPDDRYRSMEEFEEALYTDKKTASKHTSSSFSHDKKEGRGGYSPSSEKRGSGSGHKGLIILLIAAVCIAAGVGAFFYFSGTGNKDDRTSGKGGMSTESQTVKEESTQKKTEKTSDEKGSSTEKADKETEAKADNKEKKETEAPETEAKAKKKEKKETEAPETETKAAETEAKTKKKEKKETEAPETEVKAAAETEAKAEKKEKKETEAPETEAKAAETEKAEKKEKKETEAPETEAKAAETEVKAEKKEKKEKKETEAPETEVKAAETEAKAEKKEKKETEAPETEAKAAETEKVETEASETEAATEAPETEAAETEKVETEAPETEAIIPAEISGSYRVVSSDGIILYRDSGNYDSAETELRNVDNAEKVLLKDGSILYVDSSCRFLDHLWGHTDYYGIRGWIVMDNRMTIISYGDVTAQSGSTMRFRSQDANITLYSEPSYLSPGLQVPNSGQECVLNQYADGWGEVTLGETTGWIEMSDLSFYVTNAIYHMNSTESVYLLTEPKPIEEGPFILATVPAETAALYVDAVQNGYGKTAYSGYTGWIPMDCLELSHDSSITLTGEQFEIPAASADRVWQMNLLVEEHAAKCQLEERGKKLGDDEVNETVFGIPEWNRYAITGIYVRNTLDGMPENTVDLATARQGGVAAVNCAVDLSAAGDGGVMGWIDDTGALIIAGRGGVRAPEDSSSLFARFKKAKVIDLGGNLHTDFTTDFRYFFYSCTEAETINVSGMRTSEATSFDKMFTGCSMRELDLTSFDTSKVESFYYMFQNCKQLTYLDLTSFSAANVRQYSGMFRGCEKLTQIVFDPTLFTTTSARRMESMFQDCTSLQAVNAAHFDMRNVESCNSMFNGCESLNDPSMSNLNWTLPNCPLDEDNNTFGMFDNCPLWRIYGKSGERFFNSDFDPLAEYAE